jgi:putative peptide zinc metalloprotease protein
MYVGPYFFVNTDDIYLENRRARITVDMAGPISNAVLGGICCLLMFATNDIGLRTFLFQMASVSYIVAYININPLMELDGYYALSNWVEIPSLRKKALVFMRRTVFRQPHPRPVPARERKIFFWFALMIPVYLTITLVQFLLWFAHILQGLLRSNGVSEPYLSWLSWLPAIIVAVLLSLPLFADLLLAGRSEDEKGKKK